MQSPLVVLGGGPGGYAAAFLAADEGLDVTLVEVQPQYTTCFFSNLYLGGFRTFDSITHSYDGLKKLGIKLAWEYGDRIVHATDHIDEMQSIIARLIEKDHAYVADDGVVED